jgi:2-octaprenyl-6-methoxyphenol hydroxylase
MSHNYDLLIVGGGLTGNCLALALQQSGLTIAIVEASHREQVVNSPAGERALALAAGTVEVLKNLGIWAGLDAIATPIEHIHVSDQGHFGKTRLSAKKEGVAALGYVITARSLETHLLNLLADSNVTHYCPAHITDLVSQANEVKATLKHATETLSLSAKLAVGADGGQSSVRDLLSIGQSKIDYQQTALVTTVTTEISHQYTAYERFTASGPLALLPIAVNQCSVVWTRTHQQAQTLMQGSEEEFITALQHCFGYRLGVLQLSAPIRAFPLSLIRADQLTAGRTVIIGNAAHQLHPVAGQGFNLGLRDVMQLADYLTVLAQHGKDIGKADYLTAYAHARRQDHNKIIHFTDSLVKLFSSDNLPLSFVRNCGLTLLDHQPYMKSQLARHAMGWVND